MSIVVASTLAAYKCDGDGDRAWLTHAAAWNARAGLDVEWFCAIQAGHGHDEALADIRRELTEQIGATVWTFSIDDGAEEITSGQRLNGICTGRNLIHEFVMRAPHRSHLLLLDTDVEPPADAIERLLEVDHPIVGGHVPTYCLNGPRLSCVPLGPHRFLRIARDGIGSEHSVAYEEAPFPEDADVREHWNTAGFLLLQRRAVKSIRWGWSIDDGATDDPWTQGLAEQVGLGQTWVRHDVVGKHHPESIWPVEKRGHDLSILR